MPKITGSTIVKLLIACFLVGAALAYFNVDPRDLLTDTVQVAKDLANWSVSGFGSALSYVLLGAVVVLPIWLVVYLLRAARGKK
ncbi:MAG: DUF6460 domain-containing protein [Alphaproteobacteria bacterium]|nr:DUF6460 domain-containing protein [Alphaproteobacteria bacterium]